ncbi:MAG TPA: hypothetical protein VF058_01915 [Actinomycetota bacterium]
MAIIHFELEDLKEVGRVGDLGSLLECIQQVLPEDAVLYLEGSRRHMAPELREFLEANPVPRPAEIPKGTSWPKSAQYHLETSDPNLNQLRVIESRHLQPEVCDHLIVYRGHEVLMTAYDAGHGDVYVSKSLPAEDIDRMKRILLAADQEP